MAILDVSSERYVCELSAEASAPIEVAAGSILRVQCRSALDREVGPGPHRAAAANPATGPIAVTGAAPGQALRVEILGIECQSPGHVAAGWKGGNQSVPIQAGCAIFHGMPVPVAPSIGVIGVAPASGSWSTMDCGPYGGNLDIRDVARGARIYLPVFQEGGLLVLGDIHAVMGDGEIGGQGLEVAGAVTLRVDVEPAPLAACPYLYRDDQLMTVGTAERLEEACRNAAVSMMRLIEKAGLLDEFSAMKFLGLAGDLRIGQACCRTKSARVSVPLSLLPTLRQRP